MSKKHFVRNYIRSIFQEYGKIVEMEGRTWHF